MRPFFSAILFLIISIPAAFSAEPPERVISLGPVLTEAVFALQAGSSLVGATTYCVRPEAARRIPRVGDVVKIQMEQALVARPDLVLATELSDPKQLELFRRRGIRVEVFLQPRNYDEIISQFERLGELLEKGPEASRITHESRARVAELKKTAQTYHKKRVFLQIGAKPLYGAGGNTFLNSLLLDANAVNLSADSGTGQISREQVILRNPEVILISDMAGAYDAEFRSWTDFKAVEAVKNRRIFEVDSYRVCSPNPLTYPQALSDIITLIHGEGEKRP